MAVSRPILAEIDLGALNIFGEFSVVDTDVKHLATDILTFGLEYEFGGVR